MRILRPRGVQIYLSTKEAQLNDGVEADISRLECDGSSV